MAKRVLIVVGSYAPTMIADMHRARHLAWELPKFGWDLEILAPDIDYQRPSCIDQDSAGFFAADIPVHLVTEPKPRFKAFPRPKSIGWRALLPMLRAGSRLLRERRFDLIYFSTTQFPLFLLGRVWKLRFGVPYVLDFHDPCFREGKHYPVWARPSLKHLTASWLSKYVEALSTIRAAGLIAVSPYYIDTLRQRYAAKNPPWLRPGCCAAVPFADMPRDLDEAAKRLRPKPTEGSLHLRVVYVGTGGPIMIRSFDLLCRTLAHLMERRHDLAGMVRIALYGTLSGWQNDKPHHLADVARRCGLAELVEEYPEHVTYRRSLELLLEGDGALVLGVDNSGYMPSKLFTYALSGKPLLASLHRDGPAYAMFTRIPDLGHTLWFAGSDETPLDQATALMDTFLNEVAARRTFDRKAITDPYCAWVMARRHAELFALALEAKSRDRIQAALPGVSR